MLLVASRFPGPEWSPKQILLATISDPIVGGDSVCRGHRTACLDPAAVGIALED